MSQHDYDVANAAGAAFRADVNNALQAAQTQNSGASGPGTTYAYQLWADTATGLLKQRNAANSDWLVLGPLASLMPRRGYLSGMQGSNNVTDATNDIDVSAGECADSTNATVIRLASTMTKRLDAAWAAGTGNGGLDTGSIANTTYHFYAIQKDSDGTADALFSASATSPTMPSGYTLFRRLFSIMRESAAIVAFAQDGDYFARKTGVLDIDVNTPGTSAALRALRVPTGIKVEAFGNVFVAAAAAATMHFLNDPDANAQAPNLSGAPGATIYTPAAGFNAVQFRCRTDTSARVRSQNSTANADVVRASTHGWVDTRGRV